MGVRKIPTRQESERRIKELSQRIAELETQRELLSQYLEIGTQLQGMSNGHRASSRLDISHKPAAKRPNSLSTLEAAATALAKGRLKMDVLLKRARKAGWKGSGDDQADKERLYAAMHRRPEVFTRVDRNTWELVARR